MCTKAAQNESIFCAHSVSFVLPFSASSKILCYAHKKRGFWGNIKYVLEKATEQLTCTLIFVTDFPETVTIKNDMFCIYQIKKVKNLSLRYYFHLATARIVCTDDGILGFFKKRSGQTVVSLWHGGGTFKKVGFGTEKSQAEKRYIKAFYGSLDYIIASCMQNAEDWKDSFHIQKEHILPYGKPSCDILFDKEKVRLYTERVFSTLHISRETHILLYAPTYRSCVQSDSAQKSAYMTSEEGACILRALEKRFGGVWICAFRAHYFSKPNDFSQSSVIDVSAFEDVQWLVCACSALLTDYSSLMYDFALLEKPVFCLQKDVETYCAQERDFYMPPKDWPFVKAHEVDLLQRAINAFDATAYRERVHAYLARVGSQDDGGATERTLLFLKRILEKRNEEY